MTSVLAVSASAATVGSMTASAASITIASTDTGGSYTAYPILTGSVSGSSLGNVDFATGFSLTSALVDELKADTTFGAGTSNAFSDLTISSTAAVFAADIAKLTTTPKQEKFAKIIGNYFTTGGLTVGDDTANIAEGYYVIKGSNSTGTSLNLLNVVGTVEISGKVGAPSSAKTVNDKNDSDSTAALNATGQKSADYDIGDVVPYTLTFTLPADYTRYEKYPITFTDTMSAGLTFNKSAEIFYGTGDTTGDAITFTGPTAVTGGNQYTYQVDLKALQATEAAKPATDQDANIMGITNGTVITIKYNATLNDNAVIGGTGNPNTYKVSYSTNPNFIPTTSTPNPPEDKTTPEDKNVVFTYKLVVNKVDKTDNSALAGAGFTLYKWEPATPTAAPSPSVDGTSWVSKKVIAATETDTSFAFTGLDDGVYKLVESTTPKGYNTIDPIVFTISASHSDTAITSLSASGGSLTFTGNTSTGQLSVTIENNKGIELPTTGGVGTTIFYIIGGLMISGALVLLIVKKRMSIKEK